MSADDVARRFGCTVRLIEQRLALARHSPKIRAAYRKGDINLDVARAFAINDDHTAQERVFRQFAKPITHAASIRNALTVGRIPAHGRLARFVGAEAYEAAAPLPVRVGIFNAYSNLGDDMTGVNNVFQGKPSEGLTDFARLLINSTAGVLGLFDVASELGFDKHNADIGQTLGKWGVGEGGYVFLPMIGPRTVRDSAGRVADRQFDPISNISHVPTRNVSVGVLFVDLRASLLPADRIIDEAALDKYSYIRDAYLQRRRALVHDGNSPPEPQDNYMDSKQ